MRDGGVDVQGFARDALLLVGFEILQRAHIVQAVSQFHEHHTNIVDHGQEHLANVFRLPVFRGDHVEAADLGDASDQQGNFGTEAFLNARNRELRVFDDVMEERGGQRGGIHAHVGEDVRDLQEMAEIRVAGTADLVAVAFRGDFVGAANHPGIFGGAILAQLGEEFIEAGVELADVAVAMEVQRKVAGGRHETVYSLNLVPKRLADSRGGPWAS